MRLIRAFSPAAFALQFSKRTVNHFVIILLSLLVHERVALLDYQQITIYSDNCCKGKNESFRVNSRDTASVSNIIATSQMKSFSINRGLWALSPESNYSAVGIIRAGVDKDNKEDGKEESTFSILGSCSSTARGNGEYTQYRSIRHIGNTFVNLPGLSFFTDVNHFGEELYFDGTFLKLPTIMHFKSFGFTPRGISWTIFTNLNYTGNSTCLKSQDKTITSVLTKRDFHKQHQHHRKRASGHNGAHAEEDTERNENGEDDGMRFKIGSIKRGCIKSGIKKADSGKKDKQQQNQAKIKDILLEHQKQHQHHHINVIALHAKVNQHGHELMTDATELRLPAPHLFKSYSFIGHKNWTVFNGIEFNGAVRCLFNPKSTPKVTLAKYNGTAVHQSIHLMVGSLRRGCDDDPVREVITPPPKPASTEGQTGTANLSMLQEQCSALLVLKLLLIMITSHILL